MRDLPDYMLSGRVIAPEDLETCRSRIFRGPTPTSCGEWERPVNVLDWLLVVLVLAYALSGYWQGFVTGAFATAGLLLGGLLGVWLAPIALGDADPSLAGLAGCAVHRDPGGLARAGDFFQYVGARIRDRITWQPVRAIDAIGGAALSAVGGAARRLGARRRDLRRRGSAASPGPVRSSAVLAKVDEVCPPPRVSSSTRSTTWSAPPSSRATSSRSHRSGSWRSARATSGC